KDAEGLFVQVIEARKSKPRRKHPDTLTGMKNLACTFKGLGEVNKAISLIQDC
ncbi:hypothetical protein CC78DRAFT_427432, partial [Lojkania enalia]